jgi:predicted  nucleic acid-binding Zn-ribbon protein
MKEKYRLEMQAKIDGLEKQMHEIESQIKTGNDAAHKQDYENHLADFQSQKNALVSKLNEMSSSPEDAWHDHKKDAEGIYSNLAKYIGRIYAKYTGSGGTGMF